jgi:hypothetical protein
LHDDSISDGNFVDPIPMPGIWNDPAYSSFHTQSPRTRSFGGGATGGMDDRFDLILFSSAVNTPGRFTYINGSLTPFGNDGLHYQDSINRPLNTVVSQNVANALHCASDHLPVYADFTLPSPIGVNEISGTVKNLKVFPNPAGEDVWVSVNLLKKTGLEFTIYDAMARRVKTLKEDFISNGKHEIKIAVAGELLPGNYFLKASSDEGTDSSCMFTVE